jgi:hypothetical protein
MSHFIYSGDIARYWRVGLDMLRVPVCRHYSNSDEPGFAQQLNAAGLAVYLFHFLGRDIAG